MAEDITYTDTDVVGGGGTGADWTNAYSSMAAWEAAEETDLDTANNWHHAYFRASSGTADTTGVTMIGWTTSATDYIQIEAASTDKAVKTSWDTDRYRLEETDSESLKIYEDYVRIIGLQIKEIYSSSSKNAISIGLIGTSDIRFGNCRITSPASAYNAFRVDDAELQLTIYCSIIENCGLDGIRVDNGNVDIYNSIFYGAGADAIQYDNGTTGNVKNCAVFGNGDDWEIDGGAVVTIDHNADDDGDTGTNIISPSGGNWANEFTNAAAGDFTLVPGGNCENAGVDNPSSGIYSTDIDGDSFTSVWSVGVDEPVGVEDVEINHTKTSIEATPGTHTALLDEAISQSKTSIVTTPGTHSPLIDVAFSHSKKSVTVTPKSHTILLGVAIPHTKKSITITPGTHTPLLDIAISQIKKSIKATTKSHSIAIDILMNQIKKSITVTPGSHVVALDEVIDQTKQSVTATPGTHSALVGITIEHIKDSIIATPGTHRLALDQFITQVKQSVNITPGTHSIIVVPEVNIYHTLKHILINAKSHTIFITSGFIIIIGKGLRTMSKKVIFDFDYPQNILPVIELNQDSTAHGEITLNVDDLEEVTTLTAILYIMTPPSSTSDNWQGTGDDLYSAARLYLTSKKLSSGRMAVKYSFDPSAITGIGDGQFYGIVIKVNAGDDAVNAQAGIEMIMKINNNIAIPA